MNPNMEHYLRGVMDGSRRGAAAAGLRLALSAIEPIYTGAAAFRNFLYDTGLSRVHEIGAPVISVGNLTVGGTGKTPMVRWLAGRLRDAGFAVAILSRGYKSAPGILGDEQIMLDRLLNVRGRPTVAIRANPNRILAASALAREGIRPDVFLLDDGFQHRRVARNLDVVLISATDPFGLNHVLPRGLLRESPRGLRRAHAIVITHAEHVDSAQIEAITGRIRQYAGDAPIYRAAHAPAGLRSATMPDGTLGERVCSDLAGKRYFAFCGIGNPQAFDRQLGLLGGECVGRRWFADHHGYVGEDLTALNAEAARLGAGCLLTTEKDWAKLAPIVALEPSRLEIWRVDVELRFLADGEELFWKQVLEACELSPNE